MHKWSEYTMRQALNFGPQENFGHLFWKNFLSSKRPTGNNRIEK
jgi:hypothetical protein